MWRPLLEVTLAVSYQYSWYLLCCCCCCFSCPLVRLLNTSIYILLTEVCSGYLNLAPCREICKCQGFNQWLIQCGRQKYLPSFLGIRKAGIGKRGRASKVIQWAEGLGAETRGKLCSLCNLEMPITNELISKAWTAVWMLPGFHKYRKT